MSKTIKKSVIGIAFLVICLPFLFGSGQQEYYAKSYARLSYVKGDVFVQRTSDLGYEEGVINLPIVEGDKLGTRDGRAEINLGSNNFLRLDSDSQVDFEALPKSGNDLISIHLLSGGAYLRVNYLAMEKGIEIHTPDASFYILQEGLYRVDTNENKETVILALEGEVEAAGEEGSRIVARGEMLRVSEGYFMAGGGSSVNSSSGFSSESFSDWNRSRDSFYGPSTSRSYLPAELYEYEAELDYYGRWVHESDYGYVWVPRVNYSSWRPYHHGRWVWYPVIGWNWVSYDPWGWAVSHYGRWNWRGGLGWYWIPTRHWGPAWVHWHHGYNYVGWAPLSYWGYPGVLVNNRFYGRGYNGAYPYNSRALTVVHRNQLQARRISSAALSQANIGRLGKMSLSSRQPDVRHVANRDRAVANRASTILNRSKVRSVNKSLISSRRMRADTRSSTSASTRGANARTIKSRTVSSRAAPTGSTSKRAIRKPGQTNSSRAPTAVRKYTGTSRSSSAASSKSSSTRQPSRSDSMTKRIIKRYEPGTNRSATTRSSSQTAKKYTSGTSRSSNRTVKSTPSRSSSTSRATVRRPETGVKKYSSSAVTTPRSSSSASRSTPRSSSVQKRSSSTGSYASSSRSSSSRSTASRAPSRTTSSRSSAVTSSRAPSRSTVSRSQSRSTSSRSTVSPSPSRSSSSRASVSRSPSRSTSSRSTVSRSPSRSSSSRTVSKARSSSSRSKSAGKSSSTRSSSKSSRAKKK